MSHVTVMHNVRRAASRRWSLAGCHVAVEPSTCRKAKRLVRVTTTVTVIESNEVGIAVGRGRMCYMEGASGGGLGETWAQ